MNIVHLIIELILLALIIYLMLKRNVKDPFKEIVHGFIVLKDENDKSLGIKKGDAVIGIIEGEPFFGEFVKGDLNKQTSYKKIVKSK